MSINNLLTELRSRNLKRTERIDAEFLNRVSEVLGCYGGYAVNETPPYAGDGSHLHVVLTYQILLLAEKVENLEGELEQAKYVLGGGRL